MLYRTMLIERGSSPNTSESDPVSGIGPCSRQPPHTTDAMPVLLRKMLGLVLVLAAVGIISGQALLVSCSSSTLVGDGLPPAVVPSR